MTYAPEVLETFENKHKDNDYWVQFNCPEFTSLCPITGQPDFAEIKIMYIPGERMVESKSLKLYLFSFRNHGDFHEDCVNIIMKDLVKLMQPKYIEVIGLFTPRGGILKKCSLQRGSILFSACVFHIRTCSQWSACCNRCEAYSRCLSSC